MLTHVGNLPIRFNDDRDVVYFHDNYTCITLPKDADKATIRLAVRQYLRGMYLAYYRFVHTMSIPDHMDHGAEYRAIKASFEAAYLGNDSP